METPTKLDLNNNEKNYRNSSINNNNNSSSISISSPIQQKPSSIVKLNVGGIRFQTSKTTLTQEAAQDSFFSALFSSSIPISYDEEGYIFIDRDGQYFRYILNYLRTGQLILDDTLNLDSTAQIHKGGHSKSFLIEALLLEADFYCLERLRARLLQIKGNDACGGLLFDYAWKKTKTSRKISKLVTVGDIPNLHLFALSEDGWIQIWVLKAFGQNWEEEFERNLFVEMDSSVDCLDFLVWQSRWFLAVFSESEKSIFVWNSAALKDPLTIALPQTITTMHYVKKGQDLVALSPKSCFLVSMTSCNVRALPPPDNITASCTDESNEICYVGIKDSINQIMVGHAVNNQFLLRYRQITAEDLSDPKNETISCMTWGKDCVLYGTHEGSVRRLAQNPSHNVLTCTWSGKLHQNPVIDVQLLLNNSIYSQCDHGHVRIWNSQDLSNMASYDFPDGGILPGSGSFLYKTEPSANTVSICDPRTSNAISFIFPQTPITCFATCRSQNNFSTSLVCGHADGAISFYSLGMLSAILLQQGLKLIYN